MKSLLRIIATAMLVFFMSACGGSSGGAPSDSSGGTGNNQVGNAVQSGTYSTSFNGAANKTWYTWKVTDNNYVLNTASYNALEDSNAIMVGASSEIGLDGSNGTLIFTLSIPSDVTTGDFVLSQVQYQDTDDATRYIYMQSMIGADIIANITEATNTNNVLHLKGSFSGTIYDGMDDAGNPKDPQTISVNFEFDAHRTDIQY